MIELETLLLGNNAYGVVEILITAVLMYLWAVLLIRLAGKRSTSQMNNFDWVMTVAMGSLLASTILLKDVSVLEGGAAVGALIGLQVALTWSTHRSEGARELLLAPPALLFYRGHFLEGQMARERVSEREIRSAVRTSGYPSLDDVDAVVLESEAKLSVLQLQSDDQALGGPTPFARLESLRGFDEARALTHDFQDDRPVRIQPPTRGMDDRRAVEEL